MSSKVELHRVALKHHASLALQEWTGHLCHLAGLDETVPLGGALRCLAELDQSAALQSVALRQLHHVACTAGGGERSAVNGARGFGRLAGWGELLLGSGRVALFGGSGDDGDCFGAGGGGRWGAVFFFSAAGVGASVGAGVVLL